MLVGADTSFALRDPTVPTRKQRHNSSSRKPRGSGGAARRAATAANAIHRRLRADIVSMRRKPGEAISEKEIAARHGVSRTPVREALLRLADERLIDILPQSGTFVARIPVAALPEAIMVRKALEQLTAGLAAEHADRSDVARLNELLQTQRRTAARRRSRPVSRGRRSLSCGDRRCRRISGHLAFDPAGKGAGRSLS